MGTPLQIIFNKFLNLIDDIYNSYLELKDTYEEDDINNDIGENEK